MKEVYMDADLGQLKSILETAQEINKAERKSPGALNSLIGQYNRISKKIGDFTNLPQISPYNEKTDKSWSQSILSHNGETKLVDLITYTDGYVKAHTPIPPVTKKIEGWSGKKLWGTIAFVITSCIAFSGLIYQIGKDNGQQNADPICKNKNDSLQVLIKSTSHINDELTSSLKEFELTKESLQNARNKTITLSDSLDKIIALNDSLKKQVQEQMNTIDSVKKDADTKGRSSSLFYDEWIKTRDSLHSNTLCNHKDLKK